MSLTKEQLETLTRLFEEATATNPTPGTTPSTATPSPASTTVPGVPAKPLEFDFGGQHYTARDEAELQRLLNQVAEQQRVSSEADRVRLETERQRTQSQAPQAQFDKEQYARLFLENPVEAQRYLLRHDPQQLAFMVGVANEIEGLKKNLTTQQQELTAHRFAATTDWPHSNENFSTLQSVIQENGLSWTDQGLKAAYKIAKAENRIKFPKSDEVDSTVTEPDYDGDSGDEQTPVAPPPLSRRRSKTVADSDLFNRFESMSSTEQRKWLEQLAATSE